MGVTIFYHGRLRNVADLPEIVRAVKHKARERGWRHQMVDERIVGIGERYTSEEIETNDGLPTSVSRVTQEPLDDHWRGIVVRPPQCETLFLTFNREGKLVNYSIAASPDDIGHYGVIDSLWCKTQFGTVQAHAGVCELLHIVAPYANEWVVYDEGGYYETGDVAELEARRERINAALQRLSQPDVMKEILKQAGVDAENASPPEVGKVIKTEPPPWRETWGDEHSEN